MNLTMLQREWNLVKTRLFNQAVVWTHDAGWRRKEGGDDIYDCTAILSAEWGMVIKPVDETGKRGGRPLKKFQFYIYYCRGGKKSCEIAMFLLLRVNFNPSPSTFQKALLLKSFFIWRR